MEIATTVILCLEAYCILILIMLIGGLTTQTRRRTTGLFIWIILFNIAGLLSDLGYYVFEGMPGLGVHIALRIIDFVNHAAAIMLLAGLGQFLWLYVQTKDTARPEDHKYMMLIRIATAISLLFLAIGNLTNLFSSFDENGIYQYKALFDLSALAPLLVMACVIVLELRYHKTFNRREKLSFAFVYIIFPVTSLMILFINANLTISYIYMCVTLLIFYANIYSEQARSLQAKELEIAQNTKAALVSQLRPDYLYDSLSVLQALCLSSPAQAREAVVSFTMHLRARLDSVSLKAVVPMETELTHINNYAAFERLRRGAPLDIQYRLGATDFSLPSLTVQSLLEDLVFASPKDSALAFLVTTAETDSAYAVEIICDEDILQAAGYLDTQAPPQRLAIIGGSMAGPCGGTVSIESTGPHPFIAIQIPKHRRNAHEHHRR